MLCILSNVALLGERWPNGRMDLEENTADICERFGKRVRSRRRAMDLSQEELAERADIHRTYLASLESKGGRNPTIRVVERIAAALEITPGHLLD